MRLVSTPTYFVNLSSCELASLLNVFLSLACTATPPEETGTAYLALTKEPHTKDHNFVVFSWDEYELRAVMRCVINFCKVSHDYVDTHHELLRDVREELDTIHEYLWLLKGILFQVERQKSNPGKNEPTNKY